MVVLTYLHAIGICCLITVIAKTNKLKRLFIFIILIFKNFFFALKYINLSIGPRKGELTSEGTICFLLLSLKSAR